MRAIAVAISLAVALLLLTDTVSGLDHNRLKHMRNKRNALYAARHSVPYECPPKNDAAEVLQKYTGGNALAANTRISEGYIKFARCIQAVTEPTFAGSSTNIPVWFAFAPWASREVGKGELACHEAKTLFSALAGNPSNQQIDAFCKSACEAPFFGAFSKNACRAFMKVSSRQEGFVVAAGIKLGSLWMRGSDAGDFGSLTEFGTWKALKANIEKFLAGPPAIPVTDVASAVAALITTTTRLSDALRDGNLAIYSDIGGSAASFADWYTKQKAYKIPGAAEVSKAAGTLWPQRPGVAGETDAAVKSADVDVILSAVDRQREPTADFYTAKPFSLFAAGVRHAKMRVSNTLMAAAFALYAEAGRQTINSEKNWRVKWANVLLAYREQAVAVDAVFQRERALFGLMSPFIQLGPAQCKWSLYSWLSKGQGKTQSQCKAVSEFVWSDFANASGTAGGSTTCGRWVPILGSFNQAYTCSNNLWFFVNPDVSATKF